MTNETVKKALQIWRIEGADVSLAAHRENTAYKVQFGGSAFALRLHRPGYRSHDELRSELEWMAHLKINGLKTPEPLVSAESLFCHEIDGFVVNVFSWLDGETLTTKLRSADLCDLSSTYLALGSSMAKLHEISDSWDVPSNFRRPDWDVDGLLGEAPVWDRFWGNPSLNPDQRERLAQARTTAKNALSKIAPQLDYGLIHADIIPDNVLVAGSEVQFIDFDDGGYGFRLFDLATTLNKIPETNESAKYQAAFLKGYQAVRDIDLTYLQLFKALRSFTYIGWIMTRMDQTGSEIRLKKFVAAAEPHLILFKEQVL
jgi:Ser/Thr protein kinase RdoA (MazF antagonist)